MNSANHNQPNSIRVVSPPLDAPTRVLKHGNSFAVLAQGGDIRNDGLGEEGIYHGGTRHLSHLVLELADSPLMLLASTIHENNALLTSDLANLDLDFDDGRLIDKDSIHIQRRTLLHDQACCMEICLHSYLREEIELDLTLRFDADFVDIFEVRGVKRPGRGVRSPPRVLGGRVVEFRYEGLDQVERITSLHFEDQPEELTGELARWRVRLRPERDATLTMAVAVGESRHAARRRFDSALSDATKDAHASLDGDAKVLPSHDRLRSWLQRSAADVHLMVTRTEHGLYPYAGVPWFSTPFGRDGIITALMYLWCNPELARGVLRFLAATQARDVDADRDAEPGKILHETRDGEMAALGEVPFGRYYGTVDATPLFLILAEAYYLRTADRDLIASLAPAVEAAVAWIDRHGDRDGDGFVEYERQSQNGIRSHGWKDSDDSIFHADGTLAEAPVALCEVQAYVYGARRAAASIFGVLGRGDEAAEQRRSAQQLRRRFEERFWSEELGCYALALDGDKRPCLVRSSNAGQCLFSGIVDPARAARVADAMLAPGQYSGWGIKTIASGAARYNPMSYHNGSVWPHDNALIAWGFDRYGLKDAALRVFQGMLDVSTHFDLDRMPELFCGFDRRAGAGPVRYPVACSPQAWAAASVFLLLQSILGLRIDAPHRQVSFERPCLPKGIERVEITNLRVRDAELDLLIERHPHDVGVTVARREGRVGVVVVK